MSTFRSGDLILAHEIDAVNGIRYVCGKDGRLYRPHEVGTVQARSDRGDLVARAALIVVDFGVDATGADISDDDADRALQAYRAAWERGDFDHLCELGELLPPKPAPAWLHAGRARREHREARVRQRKLNTSMVPVLRALEDLAKEVAGAPSTAGIDDSIAS